MVSPGSGFRLSDCCLFMGAVRISLPCLGAHSTPLHKRTSPHHAAHLLLSKVIPPPGCAELFCSCGRNTSGIHPRTPASLHLCGARPVMEKDLRSISHRQVLSVDTAERAVGQIDMAPAL